MGAQGLAAPLLDCNLQAFALASETMVAMKAMKAGARAMTGGVLTKKIAESTQLTTLKLKHKAARKAGTKMMFGKEVKVAAKPASKVVKAFPAKALKDSI